MAVTHAITRGYFDAMNQNGPVATGVVGPGVRGRVRRGLPLGPGALREIGVRMAIGGSARGIQRQILGEGLILALPGGVIGLLVALPATRLLDGLLCGVAPLDPLTFVAVLLVLAGAALLAVYVPARRATRVDPAAVLRGEA